MFEEDDVIDDSVSLNVINERIMDDNNNNIILSWIVRNEHENQVNNDLILGEEYNSSSSSEDRILNCSKIEIRFEELEVDNDLQKESNNEMVEETIISSEKMNLRKPKKGKKLV